MIFQYNTMCCYFDIRCEFLRLKTGNYTCENKKIYSKMCIIFEYIIIFTLFTNDKKTCILNFQKYKFLVFKNCTQTTSAKLIKNEKRAFGAHPKHHLITGFSFCI